MVLYLCTPGAAVVRAEERDRIFFGSITRSLSLVLVQKLQRGEVDLADFAQVPRVQVPKSNEAKPSWT